MTRTAEGMRGLTACVLAAALAATAAVAGLAAAGRQSRLSPHETTTARIDGATIRITYGRPYMRGRRIFGGLVPYGRIWMPGADEATIFQTDRALRFSNTITVPAGSYSLYTMPSPRHWQLIINRQTGQWHTEYNPAMNLARISMKIEPLSPPVEQLLIRAVPRAGGGGTLELAWERTLVSVAFSVVR